MLSYDAMIQARKDPNNLTKFNTLADDLSKFIRETFKDIYNADNELIKECDDCFNKYPNVDSEENLRCRINKLSSTEKERFLLILDTRQLLFDVNSKKIPYKDYIQIDKLNTRVIAVAEIHDKNIMSNKKIIRANSGPDPDDRLLFAKTPLSDTIFDTLKQTKNDAEIKIFDYVHRSYPNYNISFVFSDKPTCGYCQETVQRIKNGSIPANFTLGVVSGKPIYNSETVSPEKIKICKKILLN